MIVLACVNKATFIFLQAMGKAVESTLLSMVREINLTQVPLEEVLSDQVYHYDAKTHHLTMAFPH